MKVTSWTEWDNKNYLSVDDMNEEEFVAARIAVKNELKEKGYKFSGWYHQNGDSGCPVLDNKYKFSVSMRSWGAMMQQAYDLPNEDGLGYVKWAWTTPDDEENVYPEGEYDE